MNYAYRSPPMTLGNAVADRVQLRTSKLQTFWSVIRW